MVIDSPLQIVKREIKPGVVVLEMTGRIHMGLACQRIEQEVEQLLGRSEKRLIFDISKVWSVDSSGVGQIVKCFSKLKNSGGSLRLAGVQGMIVSVLKLTRVDEIIGIYPTALEAAGDFLSEGEVQGKGD
jgi:anti-sigma B factor antagonist